LGHINHTKIVCPPAVGSHKVEPSTELQSVILDSSILSRTDGFMPISFTHAYIIHPCHATPIARPIHFANVFMVHRSSCMLNKSTFTVFSSMRKHKTFTHQLTKEMQIHQHFSTELSAVVHAAGLDAHSYITHSFCIEAATTVNCRLV